MTAQIGDRVATLDATHPQILTIDSVGHLADGHTWLSTHDLTGAHVYVAGEDVVSVGRHSAADPTLIPAARLLDAENRCWRHGRGSTICGELYDPAVGSSAPAAGVSYIVSFDRLGHDQVSPLVARARCADELAEQIDRYVRSQMPLAGQLDVVVDLGAMSGRVLHDRQVIGALALDYNTASSTWRPR